MYDSSPPRKKTIKYYSEISIINMHQQLSLYRLVNCFISLYIHIIGIMNDVIMVRVGHTLLMMYS